MVSTGRYMFKSGGECHRRLKLNFSTSINISGMANNRMTKTQLVQVKPAEFLIKMDKKEEQPQLQTGLGKLHQNVFEWQKFAKVRSLFDEFMTTLSLRNPLGLSKISGKTHDAFFTINVKQRLPAQVLTKVPGCKE